MSIGDNIRQRRHDLHLTLEEVAAKVGISRQTMSRYETGIIANIPSDKIESLARALQTTPSFLMGWEKQDTQKESALTGSRTPPIIVGKLAKIVAEYEETRNQDRLISEIMNLDAGDREALLAVALKIIYAVQQGAVDVVDDTGKPITPRTRGPQDAPAPQEGKDTTPAADGPEGSQEGK